jgi:hypothetical protein
MEDLGRILIDIKDSAGGGGGSAGGGVPSGGGASGSGAAGGGPRTQPRLIPVPPAQTATPPVSRFQQFLSGVQTVSAAKGAFAGLVRSPSLGGFASAFSGSGAIGTALAALGPVAAVAGVAVAALAVTAIAAKVALDFMKRSADAIADRIREVTRYSGALMSAVAQERFAEFQRSLREAAVNGRLYAAVQREATRAGNATANMMIQWNRILSYAAIAWHRMTAALATAMERLLRFVNLGIDAMSRLLGTGGAKSGSDQPSYILYGISWLFGGFFGKLYVALMAVLKYLKLIDDNTKPQNNASMNDWFRADVAAMVGNKRYSQVGQPPVHSGMNYQQYRNQVRGAR